MTSLIRVPIDLPIKFTTYSNHIFFSTYSNDKKTIFSETHSKCWTKPQSIVYFINPAEKGTSS